MDEDIIRDPGKEPRSRPSPPSLPTNTASSTALFYEIIQYKPLDTSIQEFRLLTIHPKDAEADAELIRCSLNHVTSAAPPEYDTLSYEHESSIFPFQGRVEVDGEPLDVDENLAHALLRLRHDDIARIVWIDVLCINMKDLDEKSSQVALLPSIYERGEKCVIWLGKNPWSDGASPTAINLIHHPYWQRVWTIPEIVLAREHELMFGDDDVVPFSQFTGFLKEVDSIDTCIPLELDFLLRSKLIPNAPALAHYFLMNYFSDHFCLEPRDHIYAFVGLANDDKGFPIDYSKSNFEVWKDAMVFKGSMPTSAPDNALLYGISVKKSLGATAIFEQEVLDDIQARMTAVTEASAIDRLSSGSGLGQLVEGHIKLGSRIAGFVAQVGPAYLPDILSFSKSVYEWKWFNEITASASYILKYKLDIFQNPHLNHVQSFGRHSYWIPSKNISSVDDYHRQLERDISLIYSTSPEAVPEEPRIIFVAGFECDDAEPPIPGFIGLAPSGTKEGDLICQLRESETTLCHRALVIRKHAVLYQIIGIAVMRDSAKIVMEKVVGTVTSPFDQAQYGIGTSAADQFLDIQIDVARVYQLLD